MLCQKARPGNARDVPERVCLKRLRRFRAGIESGISRLKRSFGVDRCTWKGRRSFKSYVWASIVSANRLTIARKQLA